MPEQKNTKDLGEGSTFNLAYRQAVYEPIETGLPTLEPRIRGPRKTVLFWGTGEKSAYGRIRTLFGAMKGLAPGFQEP